jgi:hypothetical protein
MRHATSWESRATGEAPTVGRAAPAGWTDVVRGGAAGSCLGEFGLSLVEDVSARGATGAGRQTDPRPAARVVAASEGPTRPAARPGPAPGGVPDRSLDPAAGGQADRPGVRRSLPSGSRVERADRLGLELSKARAPRGRAGRGRHCPHRMAPDKKTPRAAAPTSSPSMKAAFCSSPTSAAPGRRAGRRRACSTAIGTTASRSAAVSRCRRNTGGWRCTCAASRGTSLGSTSGPFSGICFAVCAGPWCSSGIEVRSIGGARSGCLSWPTRDWPFTSSLPMRPSSTRPNTSGPRPIAPWRTAAPTTLPSYGGDWTPPPGASGARNGSSGPASMRQISRGLDEPRLFLYLCESQ